MGRTNPTYRDVLRGLEDNWQSYRRALRHRDQEHFDRLWEQASNYADAAGYHNSERDLDLVLFSVAVAQERRIAALEETVETLTDSDSTVSLIASESVFNWSCS